MPEFVLQGADAPEFQKLDSFTQGYIEALFFTEEERLCEEGNEGREMPSVVINTATMESRFEGGNSYGAADLAPCALASIIADCTAFQADNAALLTEAYGRDYDAEQAGRDLWFTRNGHGVGYSDREQLRPDTPDYAEACAAVVAARDDAAAWNRADAKRSAIDAKSIGSQLDKVASAMRETDAYVGDDGKVYLS